MGRVAAEQPRGRRAHRPQVHQAEVLEHDAGAVGVVAAEQSAFADLQPGPGQYSHSRPSQRAYLKVNEVV